jgi:hypothetical protein
MAPINRRQFFCAQQGRSLAVRGHRESARNHILESSQPVWPRRGGTDGGAAGARSGWILRRQHEECRHGDRAGSFWLRAAQREETRRPGRPATRIRDSAEGYQLGLFATSGLQPPAHQGHRRAARDSGPQSFNEFSRSLDIFLNQPVSMLACYPNPAGCTRARSI